MTVETSPWTFKQRGCSCLSILPPDSSTLISKWNAKCYFHPKRGLGTLSDRPVCFLPSPGKMRLTWSLVQEWLETRNGTALAHVLDTSVHGCSWCTVWGLSMADSCITFRSAVFPMIVKPSEPDWETKCLDLISWLECDTLSLQYLHLSQYSNSSIWDTEFGVFMSWKP